MNLLYHKSFYSNNYLKNTRLGQKTILMIAFSFLGVFLMPLIDVLTKVELSLNVLLLILCCFGKRSIICQLRIQKVFQKKFEGLFGINEYEKENFKQQTKYSQLIFEDLLMLILDALIFSGVLRVPKINIMGKSVLLQVASTVLSIWMVC